jgi:hypothetical protein
MGHLAAARIQDLKDFAFSSFERNVHEELVRKTAHPE